MFNFSKLFGSEKSFGQDERERVIENARRAIEVARSNPNMFKEGLDTDVALRDGIEKASIDPEITCTVLNTSLDEIREFFGPEIALRFAGKESNSEEQQAA